MKPGAERGEDSTMSTKRPAGGWQFQRVTTHPGEMLVEEFLKPLGISQNQLALGLRIPANRIGQIVRGLRGVTPETALRLARDSGTVRSFG